LPIFSAIVPSRPPAFMPSWTCLHWPKSPCLARRSAMTASDIQCRLEVYLELRCSLGFVVCYEAYALKQLLQSASPVSGGAQWYPPIPAAECFLPVWPRTAFVVHDAASDFRADSWCGRRKEKRWTARTLLTFVPARICCRTPAGVVPSGHECQFLVATLVCLFGCLNKEETYWYLTAAPELLTAAGDAFCRYRDGGEAKCLHPHPHPWPLRSCSFSSPGI